MSAIELLKWDTDFFGYPVGKLQLKNENELSEELLADNLFKLIYVFSEVKLSENTGTRLKLKEVDQKITLVKEVPGKLENNQFMHIKALNELNDELLNLVYQSGHYSRFKIDPEFRQNEFEKLYQEWISRAFKKEAGEQVFGYFSEDKLLGFITLGLKEQLVNIGLIAVDEKSRGKRIGQILLDMANDYAIKNKRKTISVVTQGDNLGALNFYLKNGYRVQHKIYIYHIWK